ncbi:MAG: hypothetical protein ACRDZ7_05820 [Acidimicrobiia bacterium]
MSNGGNGRASGGGGNRKARPTRGRGGSGQSPGSNQNQSAARRGRNDADFWGRPPESPPPVIKVRPSTDPAALPRSLGDPPLGPNPAAAAHHLAVIYEEAVRAGTALAAASGLLEVEEEAAVLAPD